MLVPFATWIIDLGSHTAGAELACMFHTWLHPTVGIQPLILPTIHLPLGI